MPLAPRPGRGQVRCRRKGSAFAAAAAEHPEPTAESDSMAHSAAHCAADPVADSAADSATHSATDDGGANAGPGARREFQASYRFAVERQTVLTT